MVIFERIDHKNFSTIRLLERWLDSKATKELNTHFIALKKSYTHRLILDLSLCELLSSEGIGFIVSMWQFFSNDGKICIIINNSSVIELLKDCGLYAELRDSIVEDFETAQQNILRKTKTGFYHTGKGERVCHVCGSTNVGYYDKGFKRLKRLLKGKKRRSVCKDCYLVWRT